MEISHTKRKILVNGKAETLKIKLYGISLEHFSNFKYLGATLSNDTTSKKEICIIITTTTAVMVMQESIWRSKEINFKIKF